MKDIRGHLCNPARGLPLQTGKASLMGLLVLFAFVAGLVTIISPCVLLVLPLLLSTSVGGGRARPLGIVVGFVASFAVATLALAALLSWLGLPQDVLRTVAVLALGLFGL